MHLSPYRGNSCMCVCVCWELLRPTLSNLSIQFHIIIIATMFCIRSSELTLLIPGNVYSSCSSPSFLLLPVPAGSGTPSPCQVLVIGNVRPVDPQPVWRLVSPKLGLCYNHPLSKVGIFACFFSCPSSYLSVCFINTAPVPIFPRPLQETLPRVLP